MIRISFSGIDGTGKSTQIDLLEAYLLNAGLRVEKFHLFSPKQTVMSKVHDSALGKAVLACIRRMKNGPFGRIVKVSSRVVNLFLDAFITTRHHSRLETDIIIYDRYFFDVLICIAGDFPLWRRQIIALASYLPKPQVIIIFDVDPQQVIARKAEHSLDSANTYCQLYRDLAERMSIAPVWALDSVQDVEKEIRCRIEKVLK